MTWLPGLEPRHVVEEGHDGDGDCWFTPLPVLRAVGEVIPGWGDPCSDPRSPASTLAKWTLDIRRGEDGLGGWPGGPAFVNPPYSEASVWIRSVREKARAGRRVVVLVPFRAEGTAWHDCVWPYADVVCHRGRIKFVGLDGETHGSGLSGTAFICWNVCGQTLADALARHGHEAVAVRQVQRLPW